VGNGEITVRMNGASNAKRNKISLHPWPVHLYLAATLDQGAGESA
jgi:hypothetical protein